MGFRRHAGAVWGSQEWSGRVFDTTKILQAGWKQWYQSQNLRLSNVPSEIKDINKIWKRGLKI